jgi:hypothetical protein
VVSFRVTSSKAPEQESTINQYGCRHRYESKKPSISAPTGSNVDGLLSGPYSLIILPNVNHVN